MTAHISDVDRLARLDELLAAVPARTPALTRPAGLDRFEAHAQLRPAAGLAALQPTEAAYDNLVASLKETAAMLRRHRADQATRGAGTAA